MWIPSSAEVFHPFAPGQDVGHQPNEEKVDQRLGRIQGGVLQLGQDRQKYTNYTIPTLQLEKMMIYPEIWVVPDVSLHCFFTIPVLGCSRMFSMFFFNILCLSIFWEGHTDFFPGGTDNFFKSPRRDVGFSLSSKRWRKDRQSRFAGPHTAILQIWVFEAPGAFDICFWKAWTKSSCCESLVGISYQKIGGIWRALADSPPPNYPNCSCWAKHG